VTVRVCAAPAAGDAFIIAAPSAVYRASPESGRIRSECDIINAAPDIEIFFFNQLT